MRDEGQQGGVKPRDGGCLAVGEGRHLGQGWRHSDGETVLLLHAHLLLEDMS